LERDFTSSKQIEKHQFNEWYFQFEFKTSLKKIFEVHGATSFDVSVLLPNSEQVLASQNTSTTMILKTVRNSFF
jgi:hypothetical protein